MFLLDESQARIFLAQNNLQNCEIKKIAGDASFRSYYRIYCDNKTYILMFAPPSHEDIHPFKKIAEFLILNGFSAPKIFAADEKFGYLLLEDFGDLTYGRFFLQEDKKNLPESELQLYKKACDCLLELHKISAPEGVDQYNNAVLFREVMLFVDWYLPLNKKSMSLAEKAEFKALWFQLFDLLAKENQVLVLRDYHADNLMILSNQIGYKQVGLLDFQDALIGSKAYDLVSLLEDVRRDINLENRLKLFNYYLTTAKLDKAMFSTEYSILSLQRNMKILGIFARLSMRDNKHSYLNLMPRTLDFVRQRLFSDDPIFYPIAQLLKKFL